MPRSNMKVTPKRLYFSEFKGASNPQAAFLESAWFSLFDGLENSISDGEQKCRIGTFTFANSCSIMGAKVCGGTAMHYVIRKMHCYKQSISR